MIPSKYTGSPLYGTYCHGIYIGTNKSVEKFWPIRTFCTQYNIIISYVQGVFCRPVGIIYRLLQLYACTATLNDEINFALHIEASEGEI